jgi:hypothetical protein
MEKSNFGLYQNYGCFINGKWLASSDSKVKEVKKATGRKVVKAVAVKKVQQKAK